MASNYEPGGGASALSFQPTGGAPAYVDPLVTGLNTLRVTTPLNDDCRPLVAAAVNVGGPSPTSSVASVAQSQLLVTAVPTGSNGGRQ